MVNQYLIQWYILPHPESCQKLAVAITRAILDPASDGCSVEAVDWQGQVRVKMVKLNIPVSSNMACMASWEILNEIGNFHESFRWEIIEHHRGRKLIVKAANLFKMPQHGSSGGNKNVQTSLPSLIILQTSPGSLVEAHTFRSAISGHLPRPRQLDLCLAHQCAITFRCAKSATNHPWLEVTST